VVGSGWVDWEDLLEQNESAWLGQSKTESLRSYFGAGRPSSCSSMSVQVTLGRPSGGGNELNQSDGCESIVPAPQNANQERAMQRRHVPPLQRDLFWAGREMN